MRILVTGAAGRLGRIVCAHLLESGYDVRGTDISPQPGGDYPYIQADLKSYEAVAPLPDGCDAVIHLGNHPGLRTCTDGRQLYLENSTMTANVVTAAIEAGIRRIVYASSVQVIGGTRRGAGDLSLPSCLDRLPLDEHSRPQPGNLYALSKVAGEDLLRYQCRAHADLCAIAVRYPMLLAPEMFAGAAACWPAIESVHGPLPLDEGFTWLLRTDAARLARLLVEHGQPGFRVVFPAAEEPWATCPVEEVVRRVYPHVPVAAPLRSGLVDLSAIERDYHWRPTPGKPGGS